MVQIFWSSINCKWCGSPLANHQVNDGERANRINTLGARLVEARQRKRSGRWTIPISILDILVELAELGASLDEKGFIVSDRNVRK